jgi:hypothetical protein
MTGDFFPIYLGSVSGSIAGFAYEIDLLSRCRGKASIATKSYDANNEFDPIPLALSRFVRALLRGPLRMCAKRTSNLLIDGRPVVNSPLCPRYTIGPI